MLVLVLKEVLLVLARKLELRIVAERFATRLVVYGLNKLLSQETNNVKENNVANIMKQLKGKKLKVIDDLFNK